MQYDEINRIRRAHTRAKGQDATDAILSKFGAADEGGNIALSNVDPADFDKLAEALALGDTSAHKRGHANGAADTAAALDAIRTKAFAKFNNPKKRSAE